MKISATIKVLAAIACFVIVAPLISLLAKVSWNNFLSALSDITAIKLSLWTSLLAALISIFLGVPMAWVLAKSQSRINEVIRPLVLAPIVLPPTVAGIALISLLGRNGLLGKFIYESTGWAAPFTSAAVVIAEIGRAHV